jgi:hypothetical protein
VISSAVSRVERYFPVRAGGSATVLLVNPAQDTSTPPLDLLKLSTFLRNRGYAPELQRGVLKKATAEPHAVVLTSVFSWEIPDLRRALSDVRSFWPQTRTILSGILPRKFGDKMQSELGVSVMDEASEALLDGRSRTKTRRMLVVTIRSQRTMGWHLKLGSQRLRGMNNSHARARERCLGRGGIARAFFHSGRLNQTSLFIYFHHHDAASCRTPALCVFGIVGARCIDR